MSWNNTCTPHFTVKRSNMQKGKKTTNSCTNPCIKTTQQKKQKSRTYWSYKLLHINILSILYYCLTAIINYKKYIKKNKDTKMFMRMQLWQFFLKHMKGKFMRGWTVVCMRTYSKRHSYGTQQVPHFFGLKVGSRITDQTAELFYVLHVDELLHTSFLWIMPEK